MIALLAVSSAELVLLGGSTGVSPCSLVARGQKQKRTRIITDALSSAPKTKRARATQRNSPHLSVKAQGGGRRCAVEGCTKNGRGSTGRCIAHGGGRRCQFHGCTKSAQGATMLCKAHGGGHRCGFLGCTRSARGATDRCIAHGGGKRCSVTGCNRSAQGTTSTCKAHGNGRNIETKAKAPSRSASPSMACPVSPDTPLRALGGDVG